jgi:hypothetical protein
MTVVTTFGSCRQHSVSKYHNVTSVQENLTYPHYTKEIIQAIEFCKQINNPLETKICFRSGILNNTKIDSYFLDEINSTDVFVIEIASRISYEYNGSYVHEALTAPEYGFNDIPNIKIRTQDDIEIEEDLYRIRELLHPKPFIVVSHIYTRKSGKRYELICLLRDITSKMGIPFMSPSDILPNTGIYKDEPKLMHFNNLGHELMANEYRIKIDETLRFKSILRNVYYTDAERISKRTFHGLGDYLRGCVTVYNFCVKNNRRCHTDFSYHTISKFLHSKSYISLEETKNTKYIFPGWPDQSDIGIEGFHTETNIFTNMCYDSLSADTVDFIKENCLTPRIGLLQSIERTMNTIGIKHKEYDIIHIRLDDNCGNDELKFQSIYHKIKEEDQAVIVSSSYELLEFLDKKTLKTTRLKGGHMGKPSTEEQAKNTLIELFLLINARQIKRLSDYGWGSGFSQIVSDLYGVPISNL